MFSPITDNPTVAPYDGLTIPQIVVVTARCIDGDSWGRIALREGRTRETIRDRFRRAIDHMRKNGWEIDCHSSVAA